MKPLHGLFALGAVLGVAAAGACSASVPKMHGVEPDAILPNPDDVMGPPDGPDGSLGLFTWIRLGQLVPDLGPIVACVLAPGSTTWSPLLLPVTTVDAGRDAEPDGEAGTDGAPMDVRSEVERDVAGDVAAREGGIAEGGPRAEAGDGGSPLDASGMATDASISSAKIPPLTLSRYVRLDGAGTFKLAILPSGAASCASGFFIQPVTLDSDKHTTVVLVQTKPGVLASPQTYVGGGGDAELPFGLVAFTDEPGTVLMAARTRFINAVVPEAPDAGEGTLSAGVLDTTANLVPLAATVPPEQATYPSQVPPTVDALGYHDSDVMLGPLALRIGPAGDAAGLPWTSASVDLGLGEGSSHTAFILSAAMGVEFRVLWCNDLSQESVFTDCLLVEQ